MRRYEVPVRRGVPATLLLLLVAGCSSGEPPVDLPGDETGASTEPSRKPAADPSITREVPPDEREQLRTLSAERLCDLVTPEELGKLAFPVERGEPRDIGGDPPVRGCSYGAPDTVNTILLGTQPAGYWKLGQDEIDLNGVTGTETLHANDCTVYAPVTGGTLQVVVREPEADTEQCEAAESVAQYTLAALSR